MRAVVTALAVASLFALAFGGSVRADDGDSSPPPPPGHTLPATTGHKTTFDDIAPARGEFEQVPGGYVPGSDEPCPSGGVIPGSDFAQWDLVGDVDVSTTLEGQVTSSKLAWDDNGIDHHSRDRNFFVYPDIDYAHLLAAPGNFHQGEDNEHGRMEVEWESAAFPAWALPMMGDWVHVEGSHIWDCAHGEQGFRTEIHPPRLVLTLRDAAKESWSNGSATIGPRPGWTDTLPGLGSVPVPVTRADVFASSDGGEAREQETCFSPPFLPPPPGCPPDWYQPLFEKNYDLFVPAPPKPDSNAQMVVKLIHRPFLTCTSDNDCGGAVDVWGPNADPDPNRFTFTQVPAGVAIHVNFDGFTEPASLLYGFGFTIEVGWNRPVADPPRRLKVTILGVHVSNPLDGKIAGSFLDGQIEMSALIGDTFRHLRLTGNGATWDFHQDVPDTEDVNLGDYAIKTTGSCGLVAPGGADTSPCNDTFEVTLQPGQPLRVFLRAEEHDIAENDEAGSVERIATAPDYDVGTHIEWFQERTSAGDDALDPDCALPNVTPCLRVTYKIEDDPIPAPPGTTLSPGAPVVVEGNDTWVTSATPIGLTATAPSGQSGDALEIHAHFWRSGVAAPAESVCGTGTGTATCTLHLNANDGADGQYTVEYWAVDTTTGAVEPTETKTLLLDNTAPTSSASLSGTLVRGWYNSPVTVTLSASDGTGVGVDHSGYIVDPPGLLTPYSNPFIVSTDSSSHTVFASAADKLTNTEPLTQRASFRIDRTPPTLSVSTASDGTFTYTQDELVNGLLTNAPLLQVNYSSQDALSGMWEVRIDGTAISFTGTTYVALPAGVSMHSLVAEDTAGNLTTLTFSVVKVFPFAVADPQGAGFWKSPPANLSALLDAVNIVSRAFGAPDNRYAEATVNNYQSYLTPGANPTLDQKVARELLVAWLNLVSGREPAAQNVDLKSVTGWWNVVTNTGGQQGTSVTTALNLVRESERRLEEANPPLDTIQTLLEKLNAGKLNK